jgi:sugar phosphate isomerase/epimerase
MRLSIQTLLLPGLDLEEKFYNAANFGFDAVEVVINPDFDLVPKNIAAVKSAMHTSGLPISNICTHPMHDPIHPDLAERKKRLSMLTDLMTFADELHARGVICVPVRSPIKFPNLSPWKNSYQLTKEITIHIIAEWLRDLPDGTSALFLEPLNRYETTFLNRVEQGLEICDQINHPRLMVLADFFHMNIEERNFYDPIIQAGKHLGMVHIADNNRLQPGRGYLDFKPGFKALKEINYQGFISIECWQQEGAIIEGDARTALPETVHYLRSLWDSKE